METSSRVSRTRRRSISRGVGVIATTIATFLRSVDASSGVIGGHHPSAHALSYILSPHNLHNSTIGGSGGQSLEYGGFTEENFEENEAIESSVPPGQPPGNPAQTVIDIIAVFGAMFVAAVAIILITVYISNEMSPSKTTKKVAFNCREEVVISAIEEEQLTTNEEEEIQPSVETNNNNNSTNSTSSSTVGLRKELLRLESLVRCHVQHQWALSIENYSKLRKRQSSALSSPDAEAASTSPSSDCSACPHSGDPGSPASIAQFNKEVQDAWSAIDFGQKPSLWRKTIRSVILRLRGQEQHKDVYVMPQHLRDQLKQMYVY